MPQKDDQQDDHDLEETTEPTEAKKGDSAPWIMTQKEYRALMENQQAIAQSQTENRELLGQLLERLPATRPAPENESQQSPTESGPETPAPGLEIVPPEQPTQEPAKSKKGNRRRRLKLKRK